MMTRKSYQALLLLVVLNTHNALVRGGTVTWTFEGTVTEVDAANEPLSANIDVGSLLSGTFSFDPTQPATDGFSDSDGEAARYLNAFSHYSGELGNAGFDGPIDIPGAGNGIVIWNHNDYDSMNFVTSVAFDDLERRIAIHLADSSATALDDVDLLESPVSLSQFDTAEFTLKIFANATTMTTVSGDITAIVPEPCTLILMCCGAFVVARRRAGSRPILQR